MSILCKLGIHDWYYKRDEHDKLIGRWCPRCGKNMTAVYDMTYGGIFYEGELEA